MIYVSSHVFTKFNDIIVANELQIHLKKNPELHSVFKMSYANGL